jgi:L-fuconolactonase
MPQALSSASFRSRGTATRPAAPQLSRRECLGLLASSALVTLPGTASAQDANPMPGWIDAHSHIWTSEVAKYPLAGNQTADDLKPRDFTDEQLIAEGRPHGVTRFVLIQHKPYHGVDNSYIMDAIARHPGVFSAVACIAAETARPQDEMDRLAKAGVRGFRIRPGEGGTPEWKDSPGMTAMWRRAGETGLAICPLINPQDLAAVDGICERFPDTHVVVDHFARVGIDGTIREEDLQALLRLARHKQTNVKVSAFYALGKKQPPYTDLLPMVRRLLDAFGPERLMWATDCPYQLGPGHSYGDSIALIRDRADFLSPADREWLLRKTAERVFFGEVNL